MSEDFDIERDVLFVGRSISAICYYRAMLPAMSLGCDWVGIEGVPPRIQWRTGLVKDENGVVQSAMPDLFKYKIVVLQQPHGEGWTKVIEGLRQRGVKVIYETDDYLHGVRQQADHQARDYFDRKYLRAAEACMRASDALIASTEYIRGNYANFNANAYLCRNGIDLGRYKLSPVERPSINVGWAGSTGHVQTTIPWLQQLAQIMQMRSDVNFISIGENFADGMRQPHGPFPRNRALPIPWSAIETYPAAMRMFDIALAPGGKGRWWRGKSDLRWLEAGALGIPTIANPDTYDEAIEGETAMLARSPQEVLTKLYALVGSPELRQTIGTQVQEHVRTKRSMKQMKEQWVEVFNEVIEL